jgi:hypothetical protein
VTSEKKDKFVARKRDENRTSLFVVMDDLFDSSEWNLDDCAVRLFNFDTRRCESLSGLKAAYEPTHAPTIGGYNLDVILAV